ncbi:MAG: MFS transporter [Betaproteobacteria bacterium]|jgi:predicted MFS family arabinose efflux permease|nr:MFS transporter [Betaproteobacteria bacterium]
MSTAGLPPPHLAAVFLPFAAAYFLSYVMRSVNAVLSEPLTAEFALTASQLGLLSSSYFLTFAIMQIPLGALLDRHSPRRVEIVLLMFAIGGCVLSSIAEGFLALWLGRAMIGIGVSACLMASYTSYRLCFAADRQASLASLMLMVGSFGGLAATLPVELLLPMLGWRGIFLLTALLFLLSVAGLIWLLPTIPSAGASREPYWRYTIAGARIVFAHPQVQRLIPVCIFTHGGFLAVQSLWMGPWLRTVEGQTATDAASSLLVLGFVVMLSHLAMSWLGLRLNTWRLSIDRVLISGCLLMLLFSAAAITNVWGRPLLAWSLVFITTSVSGLIYAKTSLAFPVGMGGRANTGINFVVFAGAFGMQWGLGLITDVALSAGQSEAEALTTAFIGWVVLQAVALVWLVRNPGHAPSRP